MKFQIKLINISLKKFQRYFSDKNSISIVPLKQTTARSYVIYDNLQENKPRDSSLKNDISAFITTCASAKIVRVNWSAGTRSAHCTVIRRVASIAMDIYKNRYDASFPFQIKINFKRLFLLYPFISLEIMQSRLLRHFIPHIRN